LYDNGGIETGGRHHSKDRELLIKPRKMKRRITKGKGHHEENIIGMACTSQPTSSIPHGHRRHYE